ncbi:MAG TPA: hypothetical protein DCP28_06090, partial [Cytophagales bacterium]|nr:hypothetical protein [Cytophagales bacterium]
PSLYNTNGSFSGQLGSGMLDAYASLTGTPPPPPVCYGGGSVISSFPYAESFESGTGAWQQTTCDDIDWTRDASGTPSRNTGPSSGSAGSYYMYVEASSPNYPDKTSNLYANVDLTGSSSATLGFDYHSYGTAADVTLALQVSTNGGTSFSTAWSMTGNQGNQWNNASVDLSAYLGSTVKFRFVGTTGASWQGDVAIDDVSVSNSAAAVTLYSQGWESGGMGDWTNNTGDDFNWTARSGGTPSNNTGPSGAVEGSFYNYTEVSGANYPSKVAIMTSPAISLAGQSEAGLTFSYHMYGASNMGGLVLEASSNGSSWSNVWSRSGNQGNQWFTSDVDLSAYAGGNVYLRFVGTSGSTWQGDMCVDAITVTNEAPALAAPNYFTGATAAENFAPEFDLAVYPNPTQDVVTITAKGMEDAYYTVTTLQGQVIARGAMQENTEVNLRNWSAGMYLLTIRKGEQQIIRQIVKE